ncbi:two component transcriptional regulator, LuxR family [Pseudonocardia oroxyli]|uniref:Two component transcriptional regulator, LuxR family n=1 Tax=Pseudonocardia oroxyli TaxID=366584 RepID=A0A1G7R124_PSEOR|nr:two component transcriptional regulator, LuxR family [Pseudonocardia oroxyli]
MSAVTDPVRVLVVDDHRAFRSGVCALLRTDPGVLVCGEAASGEEAVAAVRAHHPDVVLLDLTMPGMGGVAAAERIVEASPHARVLVLSMADDDHSVLAALRAGARGYLLKGSGRAQILRAVRAVAAGEAALGPSVAARLGAFLAPTPPPVDPFPELTARESDVLALLAQNLTNPQIAARMGIGDKTVRNHVSAIFGKLGVADRAGAAELVRLRGGQAPSSPGESSGAR